jgi:hypothetical protein
LGAPPPPSENNEIDDREVLALKHIQRVSKIPPCAQQADVSLAAVFALVSDILTAVALAVTAKESSELPDLTGLFGAGGDGSDGSA